MAKIIYKNLTYQILGICFEAQNILGSNYHEKYYQRALEQLFIKHKIRYEKEFSVSIVINNKKIGHHFVDFLIEDKIILELKKGNKYKMGDVKQVLMYLKSSNKKLELLIYFGSVKMTYKRIVNSSNS